MSAKLKHTLYHIMERDDHVVGRLVDVALLLLISLNVVVVILETVPSLARAHGTLFYLIDLVSVVVFTIEYLLRLWVCTADSAFEGPIVGRLKYVLTPMALIDLVAILPFYLPFFFTFELRMLRLIRLLRLLKVVRYSESLRIFGDVYRMKKSELTMCFLTILFLLVMASALVFHVEHEAQPEVFSSIPAAMWWGVATLTTVGYGDIYPITPLGKFFGAIIALLGIGLFALPAGILGSGFVVALRRKASSKFFCPHCNEEITRE